jgi:pimeloyl-ACP methyl ester carboxylesterase
VPALTEAFEQQGVEPGPAAWPAAWGARFRRRALLRTARGRTAVSTRGFHENHCRADIRADVPKIACPTLVITTQGSGLATVDETRAWQQTIPDSELLVLPGDSYHVAASDAAQCAQATLKFIERPGS